MGLNKKIMLIPILALVTILIAISFNLIFNLNLVENLILGWSLTVIYAILGLFILKNILSSSNRVIIKEIEKPIYLDREIIKEVPVEREIIKEIPVEKEVYVSSLPEEKSNIPKYDYVASTKTKTFHTRNCRLGKLIKKNFKLSNNDPSFFIKKKYKPCKICMKK
jgi:hypothetical protein